MRPPPRPPHAHSAPPAATPLFLAFCTAPLSCLLRHCQALILPTFIREARPGHTSHTGSPSGSQFPPPSSALVTSH